MGRVIRLHWTTMVTMVIFFVLFPAGIAQADSKMDFGGEDADHFWQISFQYCKDGFTVTANEQTHPDGTTGDNLAFSLQLAQAAPVVTAPLPSRIAGGIGGSNRQLASGTAIFYFTTLQAVGTPVHLTIERWDHGNDNANDDTGDGSVSDDRYTNTQSGVTSGPVSVADCLARPGAHITANTLICSSFAASGTGNPPNGYAAVRVWNNTTGTTLVDSYVNTGSPATYVPIGSDGTYSLSIGFPAQATGSRLTARVYRAPAATYGSWDGGYFDDVALNCEPTAGVHIAANALTCSSFAASGTASPANGYAAVRVWKDHAGGTPLIDSYVNTGMPAKYAPIGGNGAYSFSIGFVAQPPGTVLVGRVYRAPAAAFGSWDGGTFEDVTLRCRTPVFLPLVKR